MNATRETALKTRNLSSTFCQSCNSREFCFCRWISCIYMPHHLCCHTSRSFCKANKKSDIPVEIFILSELVSSLNRICLPFCLINWLDSWWFLPTISFLVTGSRNLQNVGIFLVFSPNNTKILHFFLTRSLRGWIWQKITNTIYIIKQPWRQKQVAGLACLYGDASIR